MKVEKEVNEEGLVQVSCNVEDMMVGAYLVAQWFDSSWTVQQVHDLLLSLLDTDTKETEDE